MKGIHLKALFPDYNTRLLRPGLSSCSHAITSGLQLKPRGVRSSTFHPGTLHIHLPPALSCRVSFVLSTVAQKVDDRKESLNQAPFQLCRPHKHSSWLRSVPFTPLHLRVTLNSPLAISLTRNMLGMGEGLKCPQNQNKNSSRSPSVQC